MGLPSNKTTKPSDAKFKVQPGPKVPTTQPSLQINELDASTAFVDKSNQSEQTKTSGMKQRGSGAAVKGFTSRGPMA